MSNEELILAELRRIRLALEAAAPKRWQKVPDAAKTVNIPQSTIRTLADSGKIKVSVVSKTKVRKNYLIDIVSLRQFIEEGGLMPKVKQFKNK